MPAHLCILCSIISLIFSRHYEPRIPCSYLKAFTFVISSTWGAFSSILWLCSCHSPLRGNLLSKLFLYTTPLPSWLLCVPLLSLVPNGMNHCLKNSFVTHLSLKEIRFLKTGVRFCELQCPWHQDRICLSQSSLSVFLDLDSEYPNTLENCGCWKSTSRLCVILPNYRWNNNHWYFSLVLLLGCICENMHT